jgi:hypothetical protein
MNIRKSGDLTPLDADQDDASAASGWDPYIFSIVTEQNRGPGEDRRRKPRSATAARRRTLALSAIKD